MGVWFYADYSEDSSKLRSSKAIPTVIIAGEIESTSRELDFKGTQVSAMNAYFKSNKLTISAADNTVEYRADNVSGHIQIPIQGAISPDFSIGGYKLRHHEEVKFNANLAVNGHLHLEISGAASIKGASISARSLHASFDSLILESVQDVIKHNGFGGNYEKASSNLVREITSLIGTEEAKIVIAHALYLNGAMIANADRNEQTGEYTDLGHLSLTVGEPMYMKKKMYA